MGKKFDRIKIRKTLTKIFLIDNYIIKKRSTRSIAQDIPCNPLTILKYLKKHKLPYFKISEEGRLKKSQNMSKEKNPNWKHFGKRNPNYKDGRTLKIARCKDCNKEILWQTKAYGTGLCYKCCSKPGSSKFRNSPKGKNSALYVHGRGYEPYTSLFTSKLKFKIRKRDNFKCRLCNTTEKEHIKQYNKKLDVHHIDYNKQNCEEYNLISLCRKDNLKVNFNRKYWKKQLRLKIKNAN